MTTAGTTDAAAEVVADALRALDSAGVGYCLRNGEDGHRPAPGEDVDVLVAPRDRRRAGSALAAAGWAPLRAPGHQGHDFWVRHEPATGWLKLDVLTELRYGRERRPVQPVIERRVLVEGVWSAAPEDERAHQQQRAAGIRETASRWQRVARAAPASARRSGVVVAVLGPDGAGKGSVIEAVRAALPVAVSTVYLGDRRSAGPEHAQPAAAPTSPATSPATSSESSTASSTASPLRETAFLVRKWLRLQPRVLSAYGRAWRGHVVLCDRHPLDAVAVAPTRTAVGQRVERLLATRLTPAPDAVVVLDAPGEELWRRKHEHTPEVLERWRQGYARLPGAHVVPTTPGVQPAAASVVDVVWRTLAARRGW